MKTIILALWSLAVLAATGAVGDFQYSKSGNNTPLYVPPVNGRILYWNGTVLDNYDLTTALGLKANLTGGNTWSGTGIQQFGDQHGVTLTFSGVNNSGLIALGNEAITLIGETGTIVATGPITGSNLSGTNTGDQTSIGGITGSAAEFNTALTGDDFATLAASNNFSGALNTFTGMGLFSKNGAAAAPALTVSGVPFSGTGASSTPQLAILDPNATASSSWNTAGTYFGINIDGTQDGINVMKDGTSVFKVDSTGAITAPSLSGITSSTALTLASAAASNINLTPGTTGFLNITKAAETGVRETVIRAKISDAGNDSFGLGNSTLTDSRFGPTFFGYTESNAAAISLLFRGLVSAATDTGTTPVTIFQSGRTSSGTDPNGGTISDLTTRPQFRFQSGGGTVSADVSAAGQWSLPANITSTSTTTGTLVVTGGQGISGNQYVGGTQNVAGAITGPSLTSTSALTLASAASNNLILTAGNGALVTVKNATPTLRLEDTDLATVPSYSAAGFSPALTTSTIGQVGFYGSAAGGMDFSGFGTTGGDGSALIFSGHSGKTAPTAAPIQFSAWKHNGSTNRAAVASSEKAFEFFNGSASVLSILGNGAATFPGDVTTAGKVSNTKIDTTLAAAATTLAVTNNFVKVTGDAGGNTLAAITGGVSGQTLTLLFVDGLVTITDTDAATANTVDLSAAFTSSARDTITLIFDSNKWIEVARSVN